MAFTWRRIAIGVLAAVYVAGAGALAGLTVERIRTDRERRAVVRAHEQRQREAREQAMRVELEHETGRPVPAAR